MTLDNIPSSATFSSGASGQPDLRFLHYNDVYHIDSGWVFSTLQKRTRKEEKKGKKTKKKTERPIQWWCLKTCADNSPPRSSRDPVGGAARFVSVVSHYRTAPEYASQPELLTFFSGDAFNPSLESSVTKGRHMVPILNEIRTDVACLGNHDLDFGVDQFGHLAALCKFPWLCANVEDPALGDGVSIGGLPKTVMLQSSNGIKIGVMGLVEHEWLETINSLPPNLTYTDPGVMAQGLAPQLREAGAEMVIAVSHMREPNDVCPPQTHPLPPLMHTCNRSNWLIVFPKD